MILQELRDYIAKQGTVSRKELAQKYALSEDGVDAMLEIWLKKGVISRFVDTREGLRIAGVRYRVNRAGGLSINAIM